MKNPVILTKGSMKEVREEVDVIHPALHRSSACRRKMVLSICDGVGNPNNDNNGFLLTICSEPGIVLSLPYTLSH